MTTLMLGEGEPHARVGELEAGTSGDHADNGLLSCSEIEPLEPEV